MNREEFLNRLEYLLQDIPEEEKRDALDYYRDYFDEAGPENEEPVLREFGSPERIAAILRTDLLGGMEQAGEFTDRGFEDRRFEQKAYPAVKPAGGFGDGASGESGSGEEYFGEESGGESGENPEKENGRRQGAYRRAGTGGMRGRGGAASRSAAGPAAENREDEGGSYRKGSYADGKTGRRGSGNRSGSWVKYLLIAFLVLLLAPFAVAVGAGLMGGVVGLSALLLALILVLALLTFCCFLTGAILLIVGIGFLFADPWLGAACAGVGLIGLGSGCLLFICAYLFYGRFLPWAVMAIINCAGKLLNRNKTVKKDDIGELGKD